MWYFFFQQYLLHKCLLCNFSWHARFIYLHTHRHQTKNTKHKTTSHNKTCHCHRRHCLFLRRCLCAWQPPPRALPPSEPSTTMTTTRDDCAEVPDRAAAQSREGQGVVFCAPPPPTLDGGDGNYADWVAHGLTSSGNGSLVASTMR